jgi:hypothetical protein
MIEGASGLAESKGSAPAKGTRYRLEQRNDAIEDHGEHEKNDKQDKNRLTDPCGSSGRTKRPQLSERPIQSASDDEHDNQLYYGGHHDVISYFAAW